MWFSCCLKFFVPDNRHTLGQNASWLPMSDGDASLISPAGMPAPWKEFSLVREFRSPSHSPDLVGVGRWAKVDQLRTLQEDNSCGSDIGLTTCALKLKWLGVETDRLSELSIPKHEEALYHRWVSKRLARSALFEKSPQWSLLVKHLVRVHGNHFD